MCNRPSKRGEIRAKNQSLDNWPTIKSSAINQCPYKQFRVDNKEGFWM